MFEITIRKENYGMLVHNPLIPSYYRIYDEDLQNMIYDGIKKDNFRGILEKYPDEYEILMLDSLPNRFVDNTKQKQKAFIPLEIYFDYTSKCNRKCDYCYNKKYLSRVTMEPEMVRKVFDQLYELGIMRVHLAGGEPTIDFEGIKNYIEYGRKKGMVISMATNGSFLTSEMCKLLMNNDLLSVSISLDSIDRDKNDKLRGKGSYDDVIKGTSRLKMFKDKYKSKTEICYKPVFYPDITENEVDDFIVFANKIGIEKLKFANPERSEFHEIGYYGKLYNDYYKSIKMIQERINKEHGKLIITNVTNPSLYDFVIGIEENKGCIGSQELITINPDGRITPCLMNDTPLGNIYEYADLKEFFQISQELKEYRKKITSYDCSSCNLHNSCRGGCSLRKKNEYGEIKQIDPLCPAKFKITNEIKERKERMRKINVYHSL